MSTSFRIEYEDESAARAAVARLTTIPGTDAVSVIRDGTGVEVRLSSPLAEGLARLPSAVYGACRAVAIRFGELLQRPATSE